MKKTFWITLMKPKGDIEKGWKESVVKDKQELTFQANSKEEVTEKMTKWAESNDTLEIDFGLMYYTQYEDSGIGDGHTYNVCVARNSDWNRVYQVLTGNSAGDKIY